MCLETSASQNPRDLRRPGYETRRVGRHIESGARKGI